MQFENGVSLQSLDGVVIASAPSDNIYEFTGVFEINGSSEPLNLENTLWANTILATGNIWGLVVHTGRETRIAMNSREPRGKFGLFDVEINELSKVLFYFMLTLSFVMILFHGFTSFWLV